MIAVLYAGIGGSIEIAIITGEYFFNLVRTSPLVIVKRHTLGDGQWPQREHGPQVGSRISR